ncbi:MAG TPA: 3-hydroxybutyrate dehydrogenase [Casimicrobiaceae bacterium]|nr:3-hydroxybutyrate dehydrogenase [Casimicrobiaceae bacterium]
MKLDNKVALVTGAASGIGRSIALRYAAEGAAVVIADLQAAGAQAVAAEIERSGGKALALAMDVTDEQAVNGGVDRTVSTFGRIDVLVSNAGIQIVHPLEDFSFEEWRRMLAIHVDAAFLATRACLPHMYRQGSGSLIYMGSVHSKEASVLKAPYVAAKHALLGLARTIAKEGGRKGVRTNVICPGWVRTPLVEKQIPEQARILGISEKDVEQNVMLKDTVDGQFTTLEDIAEIALFFAAFPTNALTGQSLIASHGWHME